MSHFVSSGKKIDRPLRRICPGMHYGDASLFITIACVLHAVTIEPPLDKTGRTSIPPVSEVKMKEGFVT